MGGTYWVEVLNAQEFLGTSEKVYIRWLNISPSNSNYVYALASIHYYDQGILLRSTDGGDTWTKSNSIIDGIGVSLAVDPNNPLKLYLGSWYDGMYRSIDGGITWKSINNGFPTTFARFRSVAITPNNPQRIYASMNGTVYQSTDGGDSWIQLGNVLTTENDIYGIAIDPGNPSNIYAEVWGEGVYKLSGLPAFYLYLPFMQR